MHRIASRLAVRVRIYEARPPKRPRLSLPAPHHIASHHMASHRITSRNKALTRARTTVNARKGGVKSTTWWRDEDDRHIHRFRRTKKTIIEARDETVTVLSGVTNQPLDGREKKGGVVFWHAQKSRDRKDLQHDFCKTNKNYTTTPRPDPTDRACAKQQIK